MGKEYDQLSSNDKATVDLAVDKLLSIVCTGNNCVLLNFADADASFVSRAGQSFAFPVITLNIAPGTARGFEVTKIDEVAVVGDLTRVAIEATVDSWQPLVPAMGTATGCSDPKLFATCETVADDKLQKINQAGDIAEGVGGYVAALVVRGAWLASLNNEAPSKFVTTLISVSARKSAELAMWAAQTCGNNDSSTQMRSLHYIIEL
jgi:hypothetical protein